MSSENENSASRRLARAINENAHPFDDDELLEKLELFVNAQLAGEDVAQTYPELDHLIDSSVELATLYAAMYDAMELEMQHDVEAASLEAPTFATSFLKDYAQADKRSLLKTALEKIDDYWRFNMSPLIWALGQPAAGPSLAFRGAAENRYSELLLELANEGELPFSLKAYRDSDRPEYALIEVQINLPGKSWPDLGDYQIILAWGEQSFTKLSDPWGSAAFPDVPVVELSSLSIMLGI